LPNVIKDKKQEMGRTRRAPNWILKYRERIEEGTITVEEILEEENRIRETPIKRSTVTRAINALGFHTSELHREEGESKAGTNHGELKEEKKGGGPSWVQKYRERIEKGTITVEEILEEENRIRETPIKLSTVTRAINAMGFHTSGLHRSTRAESEFKTGTATAAEAGGEPKKRGPGPGWVQKYRERIERGTITLEEILEEENKIRDKPIKLSTVRRAINAMGFHASELRKGAETGAETGAEEEAEEDEWDKVPYWLRKYRDRIEKGTITADEILEEENKIRDKPIKLSTLARALNIIAGSVREKVKKPKSEDFHSTIGEISEATRERFDAIKSDWERDLGRKLHNDYFMNILLALAKLIGYGKTLTMNK